MTAHTDAEDSLAAYLDAAADFRAAVATVRSTNWCVKYACDVPSLDAVITALDALDDAQTDLLAKLAETGVEIVPTE